MDTATTPATTPVRRGRGRPREWSEARIRTALLALMEGRSRFPTEQVIIRCGERGLRDALQYHTPLGATHGGMRTWAASLGYTVRYEPQHSPDELVGRPASRQRVMQEESAR